MHVWTASKRLGGGRFASALGQLLTTDDRYQTVDSAGDADKICLVESNQFKTADYVDEILADPMINSFADRCFCINYEDDALGILPGFYAGLPKCRFEPDRHVATCYLKPLTNEDLQRADWLMENRKRFPKHLISFRGAMSHPVRRRLLSLAPLFRSLGPIEHINRWFDHTQDEKLFYWNALVDSKFVLCPRGISPVSIRLFEVMESARVPIIIADEWVPPSGIDWDACSIRVAENEISRIPEIVRANESRWARMANESRTAWEKNFSPYRKLPTALDRWFSQIDSIDKKGSVLKTLQSYRHFQRRWKLGWTIPQRFWRRLLKCLVR